MRTFRWGRCAAFGAAVMLTAGVSLAAVGDLTHCTNMPAAGSLYGVSYRVVTVPADPAAVGLKHADAVFIKTDVGLCVAFDADDAKAKTLNVARIDKTGAGTFAEAETVKLVLPTGSGAAGASGGGVTIRAVQAGGTIEARTLRALQSRARVVSSRLRPIPVTITKDGKAVPAILRGTYSKRGGKPVASISLAVAAEGECAFGGEVRKILVLDSNRNLTIGDVTTIERSGRTYTNADYYMVANADGGFASLRYGRARIGQGVEVSGRYYQVNVTGMKAAAKGLPCGSLAIDAKWWTCRLMSPTGGVFTVTGGAEPVSAPAGEYRVYFQVSENRGADGKGPTISGSASKPITIEVGKTATARYGHGLSASIAVAKRAGKVRLGVTQTDANGSRISGLFAGGKRPKAPAVEVVDKAGKIVYTAKMAYG